MKNISKTTYIIALISLLIGVLIGSLFFKNSPNKKTIPETSLAPNSELWTCSMHPQIRMAKSGDCPICGMDLIPLSTNESSEENQLEIKMSPTAMQLASVQTAIVKKEVPEKAIKLNGKIQIDESLISSQTSHISGRIEQLLVNTTGEHITKGQVVAYVYSPELISAQEELFEAKKIQSTNPKLFKAVKDKLKNWKLTDAQIEIILEKDEPIEHFPILADISGVVTTKRVQLGDHIMAGTSLFEIAQLTNVWALFDVYESDMQWVKVGDKITYTVQSIPGSKFKGKVSFIDPIINPKTRVAQARVVIKNNANLKPEMFINGTLKSTVEENIKTIVIPKSAVMWTGEKSVVYVKTNNTQGVIFMMREVSLGTSLGNSYIIKEGLKEGEEIATHGTFSIDAAAQLAGKPSMMNPEGGIVMTGHNHGGNTTPSKNKKLTPVVSVSKDVKATLQPLISTYLELKNNLVNDDFENAVNTSKNLEGILSKINMSIFKGDAHNVWMKHSTELKQQIAKSSQSENMEMLRKQFIYISEQIIQLAKTFQLADTALYIQHCPMANSNNGADWLSNEKKIMNPYFGAAMLKCGEVKDSIK